MAGELNIPLDENRDTGLTLIGSVWSEQGVQQGSDVTMTESSTGSAYYTGDFDFSTLADGQYYARFYTATRRKGGGPFYIRDGAEVSAADYATYTQVAALNDFDPDTDVVANVALVDVTTVNTDMRGTDNAATVPDVKQAAIVGANS